MENFCFREQLYESLKNTFSSRMVDVIFILFPARKTRAAPAKAQYHVRAILRF